MQKKFSLRLARQASYQAVFAVLVVVIFATIVLAAPLSNQQAGKSAGTQAITVMTYNIQQLGYANWMANHFEKQRLALIPEAIQALATQPDILILQEVFTEHSFKFLLREMSDIYPYHTQVVGEDCTDSRWNSIAGNCKASLFKGNGGVFIFSRWPIEQQHAYVFDVGRVSKTFDFLARKGVVYAKIQVERDNPKQQKERIALHVFGTHLQASVEEHDIRLLQLDEMRRFIDGFKIPKGEPVILGGDFNVNSNDRSRFNDLLAHSVANVVLPEGGVGSISESTNHYLRLIAGSDSEVRPDLTLDYLLFRTDHRQPVNKPTLQVINFKSRTPWLGSRLFNSDVELHDLSDHYPAILEFEF